MMRTASHNKKKETKVQYNEIPRVELAFRALASGMIKTTYFSLGTFSSD